MSPRSLPLSPASRPMPRLRRAALIAALALIALPAGGCSSLTGWFTKEEVVPDEPAEKLYNEGVFLLNQKSDYKVAAKKFEEVERQHPYSEWARKSLLMVAYARYEAKDYDEAINAAKRYVTLHPGSPDAPYAQYLIGSAMYEQIPDITRDQSRSEKALQAFDEVTRKH